MAKLKDVAAFLDERLNIAKFRSDASNNGLQFEGGQDVFKAVFAVDASHALFTTAADLDADFIFVHHGISWGGSLKRILSLDAKRVAMLAANSISLYGAHLPLDAHPEIGHNALLARMMKLENPSPFGEYDSLQHRFSGNAPEGNDGQRTGKASGLATCFPRVLTIFSVILNGKSCVSGRFPAAELIRRCSVNCMRSASIAW